VNATQLTERKAALAQKIQQAQQLAHGGKAAQGDDALLLGVLARTDAVFLPYRSADSGSRPILWERRREFFTNGIRSQGAGGSAGARMSASRQLGALRGDGRLILRGGTTKTTHARLSQVEDDRLRRLCGLPTLTAALVALDLLAVLMVEQSKTFLGRSWVGETALGETEYNHPRAAHILGVVQDLFLPLLVAGLVETNSDRDGRGFYGLSDSGKALADDRIETGKADPDACPPEQAAGDDALLRRYAEARTNERDRLRQAKPERESEIGDIPLPVCWPAATRCPPAGPPPDATRPQAGKKGKQQCTIAP